MEHCGGDRESLLLGVVEWLEDTVLLVVLAKLVGGKPLVLKLVQLKIITGELSCKSGNDEEMEEPLIDFVNFEAHVATDDWLLFVCGSLVKGFWEVSIDLRVLKRRMLLDIVKYLKS